jgi:type II secretory pathway pseudopilin PulG
MNKRGFGSYTLGELLFSIAIVSIGALALASSITEFRQIETAVATTTSIVNLEQTLLAELASAKSYSDETVKVALRTVGVSARLQFALAPGVFIHPNETVYLNRQFRVCTTYPIGECGYKVRLTLSPQSPRAFSYEVASSFVEAALSLSGSGRHEFVIPQAFFRDPSLVACDTRREVGLTGLVSSERYSCLGRPLKTCAPGTLPKALAVDASLVGRACPTGYKSASTCTLVNVRATAGRCGKGIAQPVAGRLHFVENKPLGNVDCGVDLQAQTCGASWIGFAQLTVNCVLEQPEFADAL